MSANICFLDTEFNATDYPDKNNGLQEVIEIGAVVFRKGRVIDSFSRYCRLSQTLTKKCKSVTGITNAILMEKGVPFNQAMDELADFLDKHNVKTIYAFGPADAIEMRKTAKANNSTKRAYKVINNIKNVYTIFRNTLDLHYAFSLYDVCRICNVNHERAHHAVYDAEDTGKAFYNMRRNLVNQTLLSEINTHKYNVGIYRNARKVKNENIKPVSGLNHEFIEQLEKMFDNAKDKVSNPIITALHDDMMRLIGRPDLETGEEDL